MKRTAIALVALFCLGMAGGASYGQLKKTTTLDVPDGLHSGTVVATTNAPDDVEGSTGVYVFAPCRQGDTYVFAAYYPVVGGQSVIGPLVATTWPEGPATCVGTVGYFDS